MGAFWGHFLGFFGLPESPAADQAIAGGWSILPALDSPASTHAPESTGRTAEGFITPGDDPISP